MFTGLLIILIMCIYVSVYHHLPIVWRDGQHINYLLRTNIYFYDICQNLYLIYLSNSLLTDIYALCFYYHA